MNKIQKQVDDWIKSPGHKVHYFPKNQILAQILEECGEVAREIAHLHGHKKKKVGEVTDGLEIEIGDVFFALCCLSNAEVIELIDFKDIVNSGKLSDFPDPFDAINEITQELGNLAKVLVPGKSDLGEEESIILRTMSYLCTLAFYHNIDPEKAFEKSMAKKTGRDKDRFKN